jgi:hypothetical protein
MFWTARAPIDASVGATKALRRGRRALDNVSIW